MDQPAKNIRIHPTADVQTQHIGEGTNIWQFCVVLNDARIGNNCNINCHVLIENDVVIGDNVTIKPGVQVWDGLRIANNVFIGPNVTFTNDLFPRSKQYPEAFLTTSIEQGASIGANATILPNIRIGKYAMVGAGSVVVKEVEAFNLVVGNPARKIGYVTQEGTRLTMDLKDDDGNSYHWKDGNLELKQGN